MKILQTLARLVPGCDKRQAQAKRDMEKRLRAAGVSRKEALRQVAEHFRNVGE